MWPAEPTDPGVIARISPGEALHLLAPTRHRLLGWATTRESGHSLLGPEPQVLIPRIDPDRISATVREHLRSWPEWVRTMEFVGGQAYSVLTVARAWAYLSGHGQLSKRQAAGLAADQLPRWAGLLEWANAWWYETRQRGRADTRRRGDRLRRQHRRRRADRSHELRRRPVRTLRCLIEGGGATPCRRPNQRITRDRPSALEPLAGETFVGLDVLGASLFDNVFRQGGRSVPTRLAPA